MLVLTGSRSSLDIPQPRREGTAVLVSEMQLPEPPSTRVGHGTMLVHSSHQSQHCTEVGKTKLKCGQRGLNPPAQNMCLLCLIMDETNWEKRHSCGI